MCVFEDLVQQHGPFYAWAYIQGSGTSWARAVAAMEQGLANMDAFELGHTMSYASLQSVVWKLFCRKKGCDLGRSWREAKELVENEMKEYAIQRA